MDGGIVLITRGFKFIDDELNKCPDMFSFFRVLGLKHVI